MNVLFYITGYIFALIGAKEFPQLAVDFTYLSCTVTFLSPNFLLGTTIITKHKLEPFSRFRKCHKKSIYGPLGGRHSNFKLLHVVTFDRSSIEFFSIERILKNIQVIGAPPKRIPPLRILSYTQVLLNATLPLRRTWGRGRSRYQEVYVHRSFLHGSQIGSNVFLQSLHGSFPLSCCLWNHVIILPVKRAGLCQFLVLLVGKNKNEPPKTFLNYARNQNLLV